MKRFRQSFRMMVVGLAVGLITCGVPPSEEQVIHMIYRNTDMDRAIFLQPYCTWPGVHCDEQGSVTSLRLGVKFPAPTPHYLSKTLPTEIQNLTHLTELFLYATPIEVLPSEIGQMTNLQTLGVAYSPLTALPPELSLLTNLTSFSIYGTQLTTFPNEVAQLTNLIVLDLSINQIRGPIPQAYDSLINLKFLDIRDNYLSATDLILPPKLALRDMMFHYLYNRQK